MTVYRTVFSVEVFTEGPYTLTDHTDWLPQIHHDITDGDWIGTVTRTISEAVSADDVCAHLLRIGNAGTYFDCPHTDQEVRDDNQFYCKACGEWLGR